jgi:hypothetical protein
MENMQPGLIFLGLVHGMIKGRVGMFRKIRAK